MDVVNLTERLSRIQRPWDPKIVAELNGQHVRLVKLLGEFIWHHHEHEDELFLVLSGELAMEFRNRTAIVRSGEFIVVPRGVEHRPVAAAECHVLLFEPASTLNTGNVRGERTVESPERL